MIPRWHILSGLVFSGLFWILFPKTGWLYVLLIFLTSFLIDFDHYISSIFKTHSFSLVKSLEYHRKMDIKEKRDREKGVRIMEEFHIFHTAEFHLFILLLGFLWNGFFYIFIGMLFHSVVDIIDMVCRDRIYRREFLFANWLVKKLKR